MTQSGSFFKTTLSKGVFITITLLFLVTSVVTLWMAFYVPIYEDEIAWKAFSNRLFVDQGKLVYIFAQCNKGYWLDMPITWYPMQWIDSMVYGNASKPELMRQIGWAFFILLMACWTLILRVTSKLPVLICLLFVVVFFSFGVTPFVMVFNRPEQPLLIWLTVILLLTLWIDHHPLKSRLSQVLITALFALLSCLLAATHPKGLFFFPLVLFAWWRCVKWWLPGIPLMGVMAWTALQTKHIWFLRTSCEEYPGLTTTLQKLTLRPKQLWREPLEFIGNALNNLQTSTRYISQMQFEASYPSQWLPHVTEAYARLSIVWISEILVWLPIVLIVAVIALNLAHITKERGKVYWPIALCLLLSLLIIMSFQTAKNFYESALIWPVLLLVTIYTFEGSHRAWSQRLIKWVLPVLLVTAVLSGYLRYELFAQPAQAWQLDRQTDKTAAMQSLQRFAQNQCQITPDTPNLVLGFGSYASFWQHRKPIFLTYSSGWWGAEANFAQIMQSRQAGGLVAQCKDLPPETKPFAKSQGQYCCVSGADLRNLANVAPTNAATPPTTGQ